MTKPDAFVSELLSLHDERDALKAEIERLKADIETLCGRDADRRVALTTARHEITRLRAALAESEADAAETAKDVSALVADLKAVSANYEAEIAALHQNAMGACGCRFSDDTGESVAVQWCAFHLGEVEEARATARADALEEIKAERRAACTHDLGRRTALSPEKIGQGSPDQTSASTTGQMSPPGLPYRIMTTASGGFAGLQAIETFTPDYGAAFRVKLPPYREF